MFTIAYILFLQLGWLKYPFDLNVFLLMILADSLSIPLQLIGRIIYEELRKKPYVE